MCLRLKKVICALQTYYITNCDSCKSLWFVFQKCSRLQLISCYSFRIFQLHSQQSASGLSLTWGAGLQRVWKTQQSDIRPSIQLQCVSPPTPINHTSHYVGLPTFWSSLLREPPTCCNHSILLCVGTRLLTCWDLFRDSRCVAGVSQADCYIYVPQPAGQNK